MSSNYGTGSSTLYNDDEGSDMSYDPWRIYSDDEMTVSSELDETTTSGMDAETISMSGSCAESLQSRRERVRVPPEMRSAIRVARSVQSSTCDSDVDVLEANGPAIIPVTEDMRASMVKEEFGRGLNTRHEMYQLPADDEEWDRLGELIGFVPNGELADARKLRKAVSTAYPALREEVSRPDEGIVGEGNTLAKAGY